MTDWLAHKGNTNKYTNKHYQLAKTKVRLGAWRAYACLSGGPSVAPSGLEVWAPKLLVFVYLTIYNNAWQGMLVPASFSLNRILQESKVKAIWFSIQVTYSPAHFVCAVVSRLESSPSVYLFFNPFRWKLLGENFQMKTFWWKLTDENFLVTTFWWKLESLHWQRGSPFLESCRHFQIGVWLVSWVGRLSKPSLDCNLEKERAEDWTQRGLYS